MAIDGKPQKGCEPSLAFITMRESNNFMDEEHRRISTLAMAKFASADREGYTLSTLAEMETSLSLHCLLEPFETTMFIACLNLSDRGVCVVVSLQQLRAFRAIIHLRTSAFSTDFN